MNVKYIESIYKMSSYPFPNMIDLFMSVGCATFVLCWIVYKINKCFNDRTCLKTRQILPIASEDRMDAILDTTTHSDDSDDIASKPQLTNDIESIDPVQVV